MLNYELDYGEAVQMINNLNKDYNEIKEQKNILLLEVSYLKQALKELGLLEKVNTKIKEIQDNEIPF